MLTCHTILRGLIGLLRCRVACCAVRLVLVMTVCLASDRLAQGDEKVTESVPTIDATALRTMLQNFDKVEQQEYPWGWIRWLMNAKLDPAAKMTLGVVQVNAGQGNPLHMHPNCEEVLYMLAGSCEHRIAGETVILKPGDVLRIPTGVPHAAKVLGTEPMRALIVYSSGERQFVLVGQ